jgi:hypothetical protein
MLVSSFVEYVSFVESVIGNVKIEDEDESDNIDKKIVYTPDALFFALILH